MSRSNRLLAIATFAAALGSACTDSNGPSGPGGASELIISPAELHLTVGSKDTLTLVVLYGSGDTVAMVSGGTEFNFHWLGDCATVSCIVIRDISPSYQVTQYEIEGLAPGSDVLMIGVETYGRCLDAIECQAREVIQVLPGQALPITVEEPEAGSHDAARGTAEEPIANSQ